MQKTAGVETAIRHGLSFLEKDQLPDGSFVSLSSPSIQPFRRVRSWHTTFVPALILGALAGLEDPTAVAIRERLAGFLLEQRSAAWSFNYWAKSAPERKTQPYPDDLDDTFCALAGLQLHEPALIDGEVLARAIKSLLATEAGVGGPYRTWLVSADSGPAWLDVDMAVNSNVAYFLSLIGSRLPKLDELMGAAIIKDDFSSPYYPSPYPFIYYFARAYEGPHKRRLLAKARRLHISAATDLDRALCLSARLRLGETHPLTTASAGLVAGQRRDGAWPAAAFYADPVKDGKPYYNGGPALTTAFVLEALDLYSKSVRTARRADRTSPTDDLKSRVLALSRRESRHLPAELRADTLRLSDRLASSDNGPQIIGLPRRFGQSLVKPPAVPAEFLERLALANLYGWTAYTIYDDFLDETGKPRLLPAANVAMRRSVELFQDVLPEHQAFRGLVRRVFDTMDGANAWELANCRAERRGDEVIIRRLPDYGDRSKLAERSLGHTLPPMALLVAAGSSPESVTCGQMLEALRHYLIARQLNDDAHDWPEDLSHGRLTPVVAQLLAELGVKSGTHPLSPLLADARRQFWHTTLPEICRLMREHVRSGRRALYRSRLLKPDNVVTELFDELDSSIADTLAQQSRAEKFLKHYGDKVENRETAKAGVAKS